MIYEMYDL